MTMSYNGIVKIEPHQRDEGMIDLIYEGCDRIRLEGQGNQMDLIRSATSGWTATLTGGGATRVFKFNALTSRLVDSWMDAFGGGMMVQRRMKLTLENATSGQPTDCIFDSDRQDFSTERAAASAFLSRRGMTPPSSDFSLSDYFRPREIEHDGMSESRAGSTRHVSLLLGVDGTILPNANAATRFCEVCRAEPEELDPPRFMLDFKIIELEGPDSYAVFVRKINIETGKIVAQRESTVVGLDQTALTEAMQNSATQLETDGVTIGPLSDGKVQ